MKKLLVCGLGAGYGGVSNVIMSYLRVLPPLSMDITVMETYDSVYHDEIMNLGYKIVKLPTFKKYFKYKKEAKKLFAETQFDVVWINNTAKVDLVIMKYAKKSGAKVISHSHGSVQEGSPVKRVIFELLNKLNEKKFYSYIDLGVACSQSSADYFYKTKYMKKPVSIMINAIDCNKYAFSESRRVAARNEFGAKDDDVILACIGRVCAVKNLPFAVKLMTMLPQHYKLVIVGGGDLEELKDVIKKDGVEDRVLITGERNDVDTLINGVDILLLPSLSEGLPMIVLEAQANGTKCIVSDKVSTECRALDSTEFVTIDSAEKWVNAILNANTEKNRDAAQILKNNGFDIKSYTENLTELIENA